MNKITAKSHKPESCNLVFSSFELYRVVKNSAENVENTSKQTEKFISQYGLSLFVNGKRERPYCQRNLPVCFDIENHFANFLQLVLEHPV